MPFPDISPIAFALGPFAVRWYALGYLAGVFLGAWYASHAAARNNLWANDKPPFPAQGHLGFRLLGGDRHRAGRPHRLRALLQFALLRLPPSRHHRALGRRHGLPWRPRRHHHRDVAVHPLQGRQRPLELSTSSAPSAPIGIFLVRIANFINGELYGAPTTLPWGVVFPTGPTRCHATRASSMRPGSRVCCCSYLVFVGTRWFGWLKRPGLVAGIFGVWYALSRILVEFVRLPDAQLGYLLGTSWLTMGQVLSLPVLAAGIALDRLRAGPPPWLNLTSRRADRRADPGDRTDVARRPIWASA